MGTGIVFDADDRATASAVAKAAGWRALAGFAVLVGTVFGTRRGVAALERSGAVPWWVEVLVIATGVGAALSGSRLVDRVLRARAAGILMTDLGRAVGEFAGAVVGALVGGGAVAVVVVGFARIGPSWWLAVGPVTVVGLLVHGELADRWAVTIGAVTVIDEGPAVDLLHLVVDGWAEVTDRPTLGVRNDPTLSLTGLLRRAPITDRTFLTLSPSALQLPRDELGCLMASLVAVSTLTLSRWRRVGWIAGVAAVAVMGYGLLPFFGAERAEWAESRGVASYVRADWTYRWFPPGLIGVAFASYLGLVALRYVAKIGARSLVPRADGLALHRVQDPMAYARMLHSFGRAGGAAGRSSDSTSRARTVTVDERLRFVDAWAEERGLGVALEFVVPPPHWGDDPRRWGPAPPVAPTISPARPAMAPAARVGWKPWFVRLAIPLVVALGVGLIAASQLRVPQHVAVGAGTRVFTDRFDDSASGWQVGAKSDRDASADYVDGAYQVETDGDLVGWRAPTPLAVDAPLVTASVRVEDGGSGLFEGLYCSRRQAGLEHTTLLYFVSDGEYWGMYEWTSTRKWRTIDTGRLRRAAPANAPLRLGGACRAESKDTVRLTMFVNDERVAERTWHTAALGPEMWWAGVTVWPDDDYGVVRFDDVEVRDVG